jgi:hypothetical protein
MLFFHDLQGFKRLQSVRPHTQPGDIKSMQMPVKLQAGEAERRRAERTLRLHIAPLPCKGQLSHTPLIAME